MKMMLKAKLSEPGRLHAMIAATQGFSCAPLVRVPEISEVHVKVPSTQAPREFVSRSFAPPPTFLHWDEFIRMTDCFFPPMRILHPQPLHRFDARTRGRSPVR